MENTIRISEAASLAMHAMAYLAGASNEVRCSTKKIAAVLNASEHHLSKVLQRLVRAGLLHSIRGPTGGFTIRRAPDEISLLDVLKAIEGSAGLRNCLFPRRICKGEKCILGSLIETHNKQLLEHLRSTTLSELMDVYQ